MTNEELILQFIRTELVARPEQVVGPHDELLLDGVLDSIAVMQLIAHLEKSIGISIPPEDVTLENFRSVNAMALYLEQPGRSG